ncbi:hypothetical protein T5B8_06136 [Salinisphaera sp. T5B8]
MGAGLAHVTLASQWRTILSITGPDDTTRTFGDGFMVRKQIRFVGYVIATRLVVGAVPFGSVDAMPRTPR